jgi:DNA replication and repair protein RecF
MILSSIAPQNFRNLAAAEIAFHPSVNIVVGRNGQGKTNLLEAVYFVATTKSFRTARMASVLRFHAPNVYVAGALQRFGVEKALSVGLELGETRRRVLMINGERVTLQAYVSAMSVLAYSSARLEILRGVPEERRRFVDRGIASVDPGYFELVTRYGRVLRQRNALLHAGTTAGLDAWDAEFAAVGAEMQRARTAYVESLAAELQAIVDEHAYHVRDVKLTYNPSVSDDRGRLRSAELRARMSLTGPQRDTLDFTLEGRPAAEVLSGGEQKMIVLFLKFAKLALFRRRFDEPAVFLLDDIDAELDLEVLPKLLSRLPASTQVFATSAKEAFLAALEAGPHRRLVIENGQVMATRDFA